MKNRIIIILVLSLFSFLFFVGCEKEECGEGCYTWDGGYIKYEATIGYDFDSAFDSLLKVLICIPNEPHIVVAEALDVECPYNDREFYWIAFKDTANRIYLQSLGDVLDTKGDWYKVFWDKD